jgi:hypothetical protein
MFFIMVTISDPPRMGALSQPDSGVLAKVKIKHSEEA